MFTPHVVVAPGVFITLAVFAFNVLGDALRDVLDPRLRRRGETGPQRDMRTPPCRYRSGETPGIWRIGQGKGAMQPQRTIVLCSLVLTVTCGCLSPTAQGDRIDVVSNPELVKYCTLKGEGKYTAVGEKNALTLAKNAAAERGGNVLLTVSIAKGDKFTTEVNGKIYACTYKP